MSGFIIEGTWEEIESRKAELIGHHLRIIVTPELLVPREPSATGTDAKPKPKELRGYGMFAGLLSTEEYFREKREDTIKEDRPLL